MQTRLNLYVVTAGLYSDEGHTLCARVATAQSVCSDSVPHAIGTCVAFAWAALGRKQCGNQEHKVQMKGATAPFTCLLSLG